MGQYWMLEVREPKGAHRASIGKQPDLKHVSVSGFLNWLSGSRFNVQLPEPLVFQLDPQYGGDLTDFFPPATPLMSVRMLKGLQAAGVDNIDSYAATLLNRDGQPIAEEFRAINIIGRIACADLAASDCEVDDPDDPVGVDFNSLVLDEDRAGGALFFRLHEAANGIVVHDSVRRALEPLKLRGIVFVKPEDWIG
jgi:hypothetical protein